MITKPKKLKVLHIIPSLAAGGAEKLIEESLPLMKNNHGVDIKVLLLTNKGNIFDRKLTQNSIDIIISPYKNIRDPRNVFFIQKRIRENEYDVVHSHLFPCNYFVSIVSKTMFKKRPKFITTEHSTHNKRRDKIYFKPIERFIYSSYDTIISISKGTQNNLIDWLTPQNDKNKFKLIENGINLEDFKTSKPHIKSNLDKCFDENTKLISMVGSFSKQKDQATIIKAMGFLPRDIYLLLVGDGPLRQENERLAKELGVSDRVKFLGIRNDVPRIFKTSDVVIVSSHWEGFGLVAVEGMASGKPVVASNVAGLADVVKGAGILFSRGNSEELSRQINNLLIDKDIYYDIARKCVTRSEDYNISKMVSGYLEVYNN